MARAHDLEAQITHHWIHQGSALPIRVTLRAPPEGPAGRSHGSRVASEGRLVGGWNVVGTDEEPIFWSSGLNHPK